MYGQIPVRVSIPHALTLKIHLKPGMEKSLSDVTNIKSYLVKMTLHSSFHLTFQSLELFN